MILILFGGLGNLLIACIAILLGGAIFKLVKKGASIILILLPIILITVGIGMVLSIFGIVIDYIAFTVALIVYFYKRHKIPKEIRKTEYCRIPKILVKAEIIVFHLLGLFLISVPPVSFGCLFINLLLFALLITTDKKNKNY